MAGTTYHYSSTIEDPPPLPDFPAITVGSTALVLPQAENITSEMLYVQGIIIAANQLQADRSGMNAQINAQVMQYRSELEYNAQCYAAAKGSEAHKYSADRQLEANYISLTTINPTELAIRTAEIQARKDIAKLQTDTSRQIADDQGEFEIQVTGLRTASDQTVAKIKGDYDVQNTTLDTATRVQVASINKDAQVSVGNIDLEGRKYASDQSYDAQVYEADKGYDANVLKEQGETNRLGTKLGFAQGKFDTLYPFVQPAPPNPYLDNDWPYVSTRGVLTPAQIQQQVNGAWAQNDARSQSQLRQLQGELAGRGFSSNSPLFDVIRVGVLGQTLKANNDSATSIRLQAAQANAEQTLKSQELQVNEHQLKNQTTLEAEKNQISRQVGFVSALAQLVGGIA